LGTAILKDAITGERARSERKEKENRVHLTTKEGGPRSDHRSHLGKKKGKLGGNLHSEKPKKERTIAEKRGEGLKTMSTRKSTM